jgi:uncharacterized protein
MRLSEETLRIMACPKCKGTLVYIKEMEKLKCDSCRLMFRVEDEIPILLLDEAENY